MKQDSLRDVYTITRLNREVKTLLESFPLLWIEGEISNFKSYSSGHWYFSLKDDASQVSCAMFRGKNMLSRLQPKDGMLVRVRAKVTLYEARGNYQLIIEHMEEAGEGALQRAYEALKQKLHNEGLFKTEHKQVIPEHPRCIGVITSPTGAVIHDIITTLKRRFPALPVILYPVAVQGAGSADEIVSAINKAQQRKECDVLIVGRGGGSLEDLWSFNEEKVARAIYDCEIPVISAVGHEVDITIADFVADHRAPTPTAAAELVSPDQQNLQQQLKSNLNRLSHLITSRLQQQQQQVRWLNKRLVSPTRRLQDIAQRLDELQVRHVRAQHNLMQNQQRRFQALMARFQLCSPQQHLQQQDEKYRQLSRRLHQGIQLQLQASRRLLAHTSHNLDTVSPLATLQRGYAIVTRENGEDIIRNSKELKTGDKITTRLAKGKLVSTIDKTES